MKVIASDAIKFEYAVVPISELKIEVVENEETEKDEKFVNYCGVRYDVTSRFWNSLFSRFGFSGSIFKYFEHEEVFDRISAVAASDRIRVCIENGDEKKRLLAVSNPTKPIVSFDMMYDIVANRVGTESIVYNEGIMESVHIPDVGANQSLIGPDSFENRFMFSVPIDGYGDPNIFLALRRRACANDVIGYGKAFKSSISMGKATDNISHTLGRVLSSFSNDEGYAAIASRLQMAQKSWASIYEYHTLYKLLYKLYAGQLVDRINNASIENRSKVVELNMSRWARGDDLNLVLDGQDAVSQSLLFRSYSRMANDPVHFYGISNLDGLAEKRQRTVPVQCTVYDLINFATEVATHFSQPLAARQLHTFVGNLLVNEYDMEGTQEKFTEFSAFHIGSPNSVTPSQMTTMVRESSSESSIDEVPEDATAPAA